MKKFIILLTILLICLTSCSTSKGNDTPTTNQMETIVYSDDKTGELNHIEAEYYYATTDKNAIDSPYGIYYKEATGKYQLINTINHTPHYTTINSNNLYFVSDKKLYSIELKHNSDVVTYVSEIYTPEVGDYSIENIELVDNDHIYCEAKRWGKTEETQNNREIVYLEISKNNNDWKEIDKELIPPKKDYVEKILHNIEDNLNLETNNTFVQKLALTYKPNGSLWSGLITVQYLEKNTDKWIVGNILITEYNTVFFNEIEKVENTHSNATLLSISTLLQDIELLDKSNFYSEHITGNITSFMVTYQDNEFLDIHYKFEDTLTYFKDIISYLSNNDSQVEYLKRENEKYEVTTPIDITNPKSNAFVIMSVYENTSSGAFVLDSEHMANDLLVIVK